MGKILFIRGGAIGDFILTMPTLKLIRDHLPQNEVDVLGYPAITPLAIASGLATNTRSMEDASLARFFAPGATLDPDWCAYFADFDLVVSYLYDPDGYFADNLDRAGVKTLLRGPFRPVESDPPVPAALQLAAPLEQIALFLEDPAPIFSFPWPPTFPSQDRSSFLQRDGGLRVAIHPGSGSPSKNWPVHFWIEVISHLRKQSSETRLFITSGEAEREWIDSFLEGLRREAIPFVHFGNLTLPELGAVFGEIDLYLGNDSGVSHLAASVGTKGVVLFGSSHAGTWAPSSPRIKALVSKTRDLQGIKPKDVISALEFFTT